MVKRLENCPGTLASNVLTGTSKKLHSTNRQDFLPDPGPPVTSLLGRVDIMNINVGRGVMLAWETI